MLPNAETRLKAWIQQTVFFNGIPEEELHAVVISLSLYWMYKKKEPLVSMPSSAFQRLAASIPGVPFFAKHG